VRRVAAPVRGAPRGRKAALQPGSQASGEWWRLFAGEWRRLTVCCGGAQGVAAAPGCGGCAHIFLGCQASSLVVAAELLLDDSAQRPVEAAASLEAVEAGD
jgi:hypothetical protein